MVAFQKYVLQQLVTANNSEPWNRLTADQVKAKLDGMLTRNLATKARACVIALRGKC